METDDVAPLVAELGFGDVEVARIEGGWASWTFDVGDTHIVRIARTDGTAASHRREARLLPKLAAAIDFQVPVPTAFGEFRGFTYMAYRKVVGRPFQVGDDTAAVDAVLSGLHGFPVAEAAALLDEPVDARHWEAGYAADRDWIDSTVVPTLDDPLRELLLGRHERALRLLRDFSPTLVHGDLGTNHILVDPSTRAATGLIDFETAAIGDPSIDFVGLLITLGDKETRRMIERHAHEVSWKRLRFYWWMGAVHAIRYGVDNDDPSLVRDAVAGLRARIGADEPAD
jgi:aminoglycoside 2''-phosphotransferase